MKKILVAVVLLLQACSDKAAPTPTPAPVVETFEQMLARTEFTTCAQVVYHDYGDAPDCRKIYDAWHRGKAKVAKQHPSGNLDWSMGIVSFYRPRLLQVPEKPYPMIADIAGNPRGVTYLSGGVQIVYAYEETIEHEAIHALTFLVEGNVPRTPEAIAADMGGYTKDQFQFLETFPRYLIMCHGTTDDLYGVRGDRASCAQPFSGPPNWRESIR